MEMFKHCH